MIFLTTLQDIETFITTHSPCALLFMDELCIDCQRILPDLRTLEETLEPLSVAAVWRKDVPQFIKHYNIYGVPSIILYRHAHEITRWVDRTPKKIEQCIRFIQKHTE